MDWVNGQNQDLNLKGTKKKKKKESMDQVQEQNQDLNWEGTKI